MSQDVLFPIKRPVCISHADLVESNLYGAFNNKLIVLNTEISKFKVDRFKPTSYF